MTYRTHGMYGTPTYKSWQAMLKRCYAPGNASYDNYGGRSIKVCKRWRKFENFFADMGERPDGMTLDRLEVNKNYTPKNCRWATRTQQRANRRPRQTKVWQDYSTVELAAALGIDLASLRRRKYYHGSYDAVVQSMGGIGQ